MATGYSKVSMKRLSVEFQRLNSSPPSGVTLSLPSENDMYTWEAVIQGPEDSLYKGRSTVWLKQLQNGIFKIRLLVPVEYPMKPPEVHFLEPFPYHLNVSQRTGHICLGMLSQDKWDPATFSIEHVLQAIIAVLIRPETSNAMDHETLNNYHNFTYNYNTSARHSASAAKKAHSVTV